MNTLFSIITPVLNCSSFLDETVQSVIDQSYKDWELIIIDDGSTDNSLHMANNWASKDSRIRVLTHENHNNNGVSASRNLGIREASGAWIALLDGDDVWLDNKLEKYAEIIQKHEDLSLLYSKAFKIHRSHPSDKTLYGSGFSGLLDNPFPKLIKGFHVSTSSVAFPKKTFYLTGGFCESMRFAEDSLLYHQLTSLGKVYFNDEPLNNYYFYESSSKSNFSKKNKIFARLNVYLKLVVTTEGRNNKLASYEAISTGLRKIIRSYLFNYHFNATYIIESYLAILRAENLNNYYKLYSIFFPIVELILLPARFVKWLTKK